MKSLFGGGQSLDFASPSVELETLPPCVSILLQKSNTSFQTVQATVSITCTPDAKQEALSDTFPSIVVTLIMLFFSKPKATFSSLGQDSEDDAERDGMLEKNEYAGEKVTPKSRRFWSSNVPWMCSTLVLSVYIIANSLYQRKTPDLWSPTDLSNSLPIPYLNACLRFRTRSAIS